MALTKRHCKIKISSKMFSRQVEKISCPEICNPQKFGNLTCCQNLMYIKVNFFKALFPQLKYMNGNFVDQYILYMKFNDKILLLCFLGWTCCRMISSHNSFASCQLHMMVEVRVLFDLYSYILSIVVRCSP